MFFLNCHFALFSLSFNNIVALLNRVHLHTDARITGLTSCISNEQSFGLDDILTTNSHTKFVVACSFDIKINAIIPAHWPHMDPLIVHNSCVVAIYAKESDIIESKTGSLNLKLKIKYFGCKFLRLIHSYSIYRIFFAQIELWKIIGTLRSDSFRKKWVDSIDSFYIAQYFAHSDGFFPMNLHIYDCIVVVALIIHCFSACQKYWWMSVQNSRQYSLRLIAFFFSAHH